MRVLKGPQGDDTLLERAEGVRHGAVSAGEQLRATITLCQETITVMRTADRRCDGARSDIAAARIRMDETRLSVRDDAGRNQVLTPTEWRLLRLLNDANGRVLTRQRLAQQLWGLDDGRASEVEVYISRLRRKLGGGRQSLITTVRGEGYRLARPL